MIIYIITILCYAPSVFTCIVEGAIQMTVYIYIYIYIYVASTICLLFCVAYVLETSCKQAATVAFKYAALQRRSWPGRREITDLPQYNTRAY